MFAPIPQNLEIDFKFGFSVVVKYLTTSDRLLWDTVKARELSK